MSASPSRRMPRSVSRPGSPGPAPTGVAGAGPGAGTDALGGKLRHEPLLLRASRPGIRQSTGSVCPHRHAPIMPRAPRRQPRGGFFQSMMRPRRLEPQPSAAASATDTSTCQQQGCVRLAKRTRRSTRACSSSTTTTMCPPAADAPRAVRILLAGVPRGADEDQIGIGQLSEAARPRRTRPPTPLRRLGEAHRRQLRQLARSRTPAPQGGSATRSIATTSPLGSSPTVLGRRLQPCQRQQPQRARSGASRQRRRRHAGQSLRLPSPICSDRQHRARSKFDTTVGQFEAQQGGPGPLA